jgi:hypothetical protein
MKKAIIAFVLLLLVVVGVVFFAFDAILKGGIETAGSSVLDTEVTVNSVGVSPFSGSGGISELRIGNPEGFNAPYAMELGALDVNVNVGSVFSDTIVIDSIIIQRPEITYETRITSDNIRTLMENLGGGGGDAPAESESAEPGKSVIIRDFQMIDPQVNLVAAIARAPIPLPDIRLQNIGEDNASVTVAEAGRQILAALNQALLGASLPSFDELQSLVTEELENQVEALEEQVDDQIEELEEQVTDQVEDLSNRVRSIFN